jgi:hypothetical protein
MAQPDSALALVEERQRSDYTELALTVGQQMEAKVVEEVKVTPETAAGA